jgi:hypothetical protein
MMVYEDEIEMYNVYNNDDDMVYVVENDIEMMMKDDQAMEVDIVLILFVVDPIINDEMVVNALIQTKNYPLKLALKNFEI